MHVGPFVEQVHACRLHIYIRVFDAELKVTILVQKLRYVNGVSRLVATSLQSLPPSTWPSPWASLLLLTRDLATGLRAHLNNPG